MSGDTRKHVAHIVFRFDFGGLENGLINLVNRLPEADYRHSIIALTEATEFARRIERPDVNVYQLGKQPGKDPAAYRRLHRLLKDIRPDVVHTRNLGTLDCQPVAWWAGVPYRIHGEHGWDVGDEHGVSLKGRLQRRLLGLWVHRWVALSRELEDWLVQRAGVAASCVTRICNGVDTVRYRPAVPTVPSATVEFGTVTRFSAIKDPLNTLEAFVALCHRLKDRAAVRLTMVGDGPLLAAARERAEQAGVLDKVTFAGSQMDVASWLRKFDVFVLGSRREGISNTILEAMAVGLPVIATDTGGNPELVEHQRTGDLVPVADSVALSTAMARYAGDRGRIACHGKAARARAEQLFSLEAMVAAYDAVYRSKG